MEKAENYLYLAMEIGEQLYTNGAGVSRVEDTIRRICFAYGAARVDVFSITSTIITTIYGKDAASCTQTRRVAFRSNDFYKLEKFNDLSRRICTATPDKNSVMQEIQKIESEKGYSLSVMILVYALISGSFSIFFGGDLWDGLAAAVIGVFLKLGEMAMHHVSVNILFNALILSTLGGFLSAGFVALGFGHHADLISIGNIMLLIPGIAFTNALRDLFSGETITGSFQLVESVLLAITIAVGFNFAHFFF